MPVWRKSWIIFLRRGWVQGRSRGEMSDLGLFEYILCLQGVGPASS